MERIVQGGATSRAESASSASTAAQQERLGRVAREFESLLIATLLRTLRATVPESGLIDEQGEIKHYRQLHDDELARRMGGTSGLGVAEMIVRRYADSVSAPDDGMSDAGTPAVAAEPWPSPRALPPLDDAVLGDSPAAPPSHRAAEPIRASLARALAAYGEPQAAIPGAARDGGAVDRETALAGSAERVGGAVADSLRRYGPELRQAAADTGIDPALLLSVLVHESGGDPRARSPKGALGLMQLMPATARELGVTEPLRPAESIRGGARYLGQLLARFDQNPELALAGYNAGPGAVEKAGQRIPPYRETVAYVRKVMSLYERLRGEPGTDLDRDRRK